jgi:hypothetical protein
LSDYPAGRTVNISFSGFTAAAVVSFQVNLLDVGQTVCTARQPPVNRHDRALSR